MRGCCSMISRTMIGNSDDGGRAFFTFFDIDHPNTVLDVRPLHGGVIGPELAATLTEQERDLHQPSERVPQLIAGVPNQADFVVIEETQLLTIRFLVRCIPRTIGDDIVLVSGGIEITDAADSA